MSIAVHLQVSNRVLNSLYEHLQKAYVMGQLRLVKRIHALLYIIEGKDVAEVTLILTLSSQTIYNYIKAFILNKLKSLGYRHSPGRPAKLNAAQRKELGKTIDAGPEVAVPGPPVAVTNMPLCSPVAGRMAKITSSVRESFGSK